MWCGWVPPPGSTSAENVQINHIKREFGESRHRMEVTTVSKRFLSVRRICPTSLAVCCLAGSHRRRENDGLKPRLLFSCSRGLTHTARTNSLVTNAFPRRHSGLLWKGKRLVVKSQHAEGIGLRWVLTSPSGKKKLRSANIWECPTCAARTQILHRKLGTGVWLERQLCQQQPCIDFRAHHNPYLVTTFPWSQSIFPEASLFFRVQQQQFYVNFNLCLFRNALFSAPNY